VEKIKLEDFEFGEDFRKPEDIAHEARIADGHRNVPPNPAIVMGWYTKRGTSYPIPWGSYGDMSLIVGPSKSMKSRLKTALVAAYSREKPIENFPNMRGVKSHGKFIVDIDTEQNEFHVAEMRRDQLELAAHKTNGHLLTFRLRKYDPAERRAFLKWVCFESEWAGKIGLVCVDGAADLIEDTNDLVQSSQLAGLFMRITDETNAHLITILHRTKQSAKPTGHIGSALLKKAETVVFVEKDENDVVHVKPEYCRNRPFKRFSFRLDPVTLLPVHEEAFDDIFSEPQ